MGSIQELRAGSYKDYTVFTHLLKSSSLYRHRVCRHHIHGSFIRWQTVHVWIKWPPLGQLTWYLRMSLNFHRKNDQSNENNICSCQRHVGNCMRDGVDSFLYMIWNILLKFWPFIYIFLRNFPDGSRCCSLVQWKCALGKDLSRLRLDFFFTLIG